MQYIQIFTVLWLIAIWLIKRKINKYKGSDT